MQVQIYTTNEAPKRHECGKPEWAICTACQGRMHQAGCTSKRNRKKDCCKARHQMLHDQGQVLGIDDTSVKMLDNFDKLDD